MAKVTITSVEISKIENVFYCYGDHPREVIEVSTASKLECPVCSAQMENTGWFETSMDCE